MVNIEICLGSSCFARGNRQALELLEDHISEQNLCDRVVLTGRLCMNRCSCGPHITINGERYELMAPEGALEILHSVLAKEAGETAK